MKQLLPVSLLAGVCSLALFACGGVPASMKANAFQPSGSQPAATTQPATPAPMSPMPVSAPAHSSSALPTPPGNAVVLDQIQGTSDGWKACSICAYGTNSTDNFWMAPLQTSPSMTGNSRQLYVGGPQWTNALFIKTLPARNSATHFIWDFWVYFDDASAANIWSAEFDFWQSVGGKEFMIGSQCDFGDRHWDTWDSKNNIWITTSIPCHRWSGSTWHHVQWYVERLGTEAYRYNTLVVDGQAIAVNQTYQPNPSSWADAMGVQWQLDQSISGHDLHEWIDNVKLIAW